MRKVLLAILCLAALCSAQFPVSVFSQTYRIDGFKADSQKTTPAFNVSDYENIAVTVCVDDTTLAGFANDSVKLYWYWQRGYIVTNASGLPDTTWKRPGLRGDTISLSGSFLAAGSTMYPDSDVIGSLDSTFVTGYICSVRNLSPCWSPIARVVVKGLTGNKVLKGLALTVTVTRRKFLVVNFGTARMPEPGQ